MGSASRTKQRRLERLEEAFERVLDSDRRFFERHPTRNHRLRLAGQAEMAMQEHVHGVRFHAPSGRAWYAVVKQLQPGARLRRYVLNEAGLEVDLSEAEARQIFNFLAPAGSKTAEAEASVRTMLKRTGAAN